MTLVPIPVTPKGGREITQLGGRRNSSVGSQDRRSCSQVVAADTAVPRGSASRGLVYGLLISLPLWAGIALAIWLCPA